ncbi:amidohydrolase family protein [Brevibacterium sp. 5221]|uniref:Amidohydrolase family protein n=1 Tax=Brevibacterium rongguiense TaxID=2695267 RepID=A0A6N9H6T9_9MICO|nr:MULTISPECIES: amidohydrolase [Brevibacterium]MYM19679.1 amidohydrolase family protein [Brevibacterium rongguiense]WAL39925.1 amidohydrolase [Brevibacterium sp. BRM-1]
MELDLLLTNARALTLDDSRPTAARIGVWQGRLVGFDEELDGLSARQTVDLDGAAVLPGFNDVHCHTTWFGLTLASVDVEALPGGMDAVYAALEQGARAAGEGEWVEATGFSQQDYDNAYPDIQVLDRITGGRPLFMRQVSGHAAIVNTKALEMAGMLEPGYTDPAGGKVVRDEHGRPTGLIEETAQQAVQDLIKPYSADTIVDCLDRATAQYAKEGITSIGEAGISGGWIGHSPIEVTAYMRALAQGRLRVRAQLMPSIYALHEVAANSADDFGLGLDLGVVTGFGDDDISIGPTKIFMDGAMSGETAAMHANYAGRDHPGYLQEDPEVLRRQTLDAYRSGWSVAVHAIGDLAVDEAVKNIGDAIDRYGRHAIPSRIEHAGMVSDAALAKLAHYGIAVTPQAAFADAIGDGMNRSLGDDRVRMLYRGKSFVDGGVMLAGSSDRPCADGNALRGIQAFVDRRTRSGGVFGVPEECISPLEAVRAYTCVAAEASGQLDSKGTLSAGKLADMVVLGADPTQVDPEAIRDIEVRATLRGGEFTHSAL